VVTIRECHEGDLELLEQGMPTGGHNAHAVHHAAHLAGSCTYLTAWENDLPVGCCVILWKGCFDPGIRQLMPGAVEVSQVHVHPDVRGRGIGTALIRFAERCVVARDCDTITIVVGDDNPRVAALYARLGYRDTGLRSTARYSYRDENGVDRHVVEQNLTLAKHLA
jgi:ribosomal protein S18 acetylase RimI-like enzyme